MFEKLNKKLGIVDHEAPKVRIAWGLRLLYQIGFVVAWTIITAMFVEHFGIHNLLYLFLFDAGFYMVGTILASFVLPRVKLETFLTASLLLTLFFTSLALGLSNNKFWFFVFIVLAKDLFFTQVNIALYRQNESFFSPKEAVKIMPLVESAITIGSVLGAALTVEFLEIVSNKHVLVIWMVSLCAMVMIMVFSSKLLKDVPHLQPKKEKTGSFRNPISEALHGLKNVTFLRHIFMILILQAAVFTIIEFEFTKHLQEEILSHNAVSILHQQGELQASFFSIAKEKILGGSETNNMSGAMPFIAHETLAHDLGMFHLFFGVIALLVQIIITSRIVERFGVIGSIFSYLAILFFGLWGLLLGGFNINTLRGIQHGFHSIGESAYHLSFYSVFSHGREAIRLFLEGIVKPLGILLGVGFLFLLHDVTIFQSALVFIALALVICYPTRKSFTYLSKANLQTETNIAHKLHSIEVLGQKGHHKPVHILGEELLKKEAHPIIREKIVKTITQINSPEILHVYMNILNDQKEDHEAKVQILNSLMKLSSLKKYCESHAFGQDHLIFTLKNILSTTKNCHLKKLAAMNIFSYLPQHEVVPFFKEIMDTDDEALQAICLRSCSIFNDPDIVLYVKPYLEHKSPRIKGHALIALWKFEREDLLLAIIENLLKSRRQEAQIAGIYALGEIRAERHKLKIESFVGHKDQLRHLHALIALAKIGHLSCIPGLLEILFGEDEEMATKAYRMLERVPAEIRDQIKKEIRYEVSRRVMGIIQPEKIKVMEDLVVLPKEALKYLKRLYYLAEKYDDILILEKQFSV